MIKFIFLIIGLLFYGTGFSQTSNIDLTISEIKNKKGLIRVSLFNQDDGFPNDHEKAFRSISMEITELQLNFNIADLPTGEYALAILHDENENGKMDFNFLRMPKEGYGVSNNAKSSFGPPKFKDAIFLLSSDELSLEINMNY
jgi:uncharacterized protein (DUF2141 family)